MNEAEARLAAEVGDMLAEAERIDAAEDAAHGPDNRGDDLPGELARRESRLAKIRKAKADLEKQPRERAAAKAQEKAAKAGRSEAEAATAASRAAESTLPEPTAQRNFTDPDARIMKTSDGSFHYCYNAQAVVDEDHQVIVATDLADSAADNPALTEMPDQTAAHTSHHRRRTRHRSVDRHRQAQARRAGPRRAPGPHPEERHRQATHGPQATDQAGQGRLRQTQGDRRAGLRADEDHPRRRPTPAPRP